MVKVLRLQTTQGASIRQLVECINFILDEINITFTPKYISENSEEEDDTKLKVGGITIKEVNKQSSVLIHCKLDADKFENYEYKYDKKKITIGINLGNLLKCLKCMNNYDTMTWEIDDEDFNKLTIIFETKTNDKEEKKIFKLNLMDLDDEELIIDPVNFNYLINLPSQDFQEYCKKMVLATNRLELICNGEKLILKGKGDMGSIEFETSQSPGGLQIQKITNTKEIFQGLYELKYLQMFTKCTNLCNNVILYLKNDYPLIVEYAVAALGKIKLVLSPAKNTKKG
ncbi:putative proliferating cell nuclear antigen [Chlorella virus XW01]|nr:putative proliferating cell nuclear antigen [Chlorella virus XW01]